MSAVLKLLGKPEIMRFLNAVSQMEDPEIQFRTINLKTTDGTVEKWRAVLIREKPTKEMS